MGTSPTCSRYGEKASGAGVLAGRGNEVGDLSRGQVTGNFVSWSREWVSTLGHEEALEAGT